MTHISAESGARESFTTEPKTSGTSTDKPENRLVEIDQPEAIEVSTDTDADAEAADDGTTQKKPLGFYLSFLAINILVFLFSLDATTLAVAIPSIAQELHGSTLESFWAGIAYYLGLVVSQPLFASISDVFGRKPPLYVAFLLFTAGSLSFSLAPNMAAVIAGRVVQGLGGGGLDVLGEIIVSDMTTLKERPLYVGIMALPIAIGSILGPTIGALFSDYVTWRWIGWINLPLLGIAFPLLAFFLRLRSLGSSLDAKLKRLDWNDPYSSVGMRYGIPIIWGAGVGALLRLLHLPMQASVSSVDDTGHAIALLLTFRCLGGLVGLAIGSTIFSSTFGSAIATIGELPDSLSLLRDPHNAVAFIPIMRTVNLPLEVIAPVLQAYLSAMRGVFYAMLGFSGLGFVSSLLTEELTLQKTERGRQHFET
ncbi:putative transporter C3H1.06c [Daldinia childiae]|uniref:putative transporter C3H1.06c n=1 Tax=Daldinia childiae TaxID=326645 RepID=UPI0014487E42|nr:putative transporter C3H1.06c [Daldinia childiae]KAF3061960.1 putative transporter C3H1.06c [Daldinia childiae]